MRSQQQSHRISIIPIVAIGASAGGLDAVCDVLARLRPDYGMAFVVIQHLDPARPSALASLLSKATSLPVLKISNRIAVQPNHVYVVPPNKTASIRNGTLALGRISRQDHRPIDDFMAALATAQGEAAMGVVLSDTGADGTRGLAAIKAADGFTFAQDPKTTAWPAMPLSAIDAGIADFVLPPARIALALGRLGHASHNPRGRGYAPELLRKPLDILVLEPYRGRRAEHHTTFLAAGRFRAMELQDRRKDGAFFPAEIGLGCINTREGPPGVVL